MASLTPSKITASYLRQAARCPYQLRLSRSGFAPTEATSAGWAEGSVVHETLEAVLTQAVADAYTGPLGAPRYAGMVAGLAYDLAEVHGIDLDRVPGVIEQVIDFLFDRDSFTHAAVLGIEKWTDGALPDGTKLAAKVDLAEQGPRPGMITVTDFKAKVRPTTNVDLADDVQAQIVLICAAATWPHADGITFRWEYTAGRQHEELRRTRLEIGWLATNRGPELSAAARKAANGPWPARPGAVCGWCDQRGRCPAIGGQPTAGQPEPDWIEG